MKSKYLKFLYCSLKEAEGIQDPSIVKVYKSDSKISSLNYCGEIKYIGIGESDTIPSTLAEKLEGFKGKASIGRSLQQSKSDEGEKVYQKKNLHLYTNKATTLDGLYRIAYVKGVGDDELHVSECGRSSDKYSAYYKLLEEALVQNNFKVKNGTYIVNKGNIDKFVEILNEVIALEETEDLFLKFISNNIKIKEIVFATVYWNKADGCLNNRMSATDHIEHLIDIVKNMKNKEELELIKGKCSGIANLIESLVKLI